MPLGGTWRQVLEDPTTDLGSDAIRQAAESWHSCAIGEREAMLNMPHLGDFDDMVERSPAWRALMASEHGQRIAYPLNPGVSFLQAINKGERDLALLILDAIEKTQVAP